MRRRSPLDSAIEAAREAASLLVERMGLPLEIQEKGARADLVTIADRESERAIFDRLRGEYPSASFLGEEGGERKGTSSERWIVDPLDGTTNFAHGYPLFCVSIAFERDEELIAGVIHAPLMNECFAAERSAGAMLNGKLIRVSSIAQVAEAMVCTGFYPSDFDRNARHFAAASRRTQAVRRDGAAALDLAYVAMGRFDAFWEFGLHAWEVAAGTLLIREAGGCVSQIDGSPARLGAPSILASNGNVHEQMRAMFSRLEA